MTDEELVAFLQGVLCMEKRSAVLMVALRSERPMTFAGIEERMRDLTASRPTMDTIRGGVRIARHKLPPGVTIVALRGTGYWLRGLKAWLQSQE